MLNIQFFWIKHFVVLLLVITTSQFVSAQVWMQGYNFRKKITIDKSRIPGTSNLLNFNILIELDAADLKYSLGCGDGLTHASGLPISFASKAQSAVPIGFQVDSYDPVAGKLRCWVQIAELIAAVNPGTNEIYFYYGGKEMHNPLSEESRAIWPTNYRQVWHMNLDSGPATSFSANHSNGNNAIGNSGMNAVNFVPGVVGTGVLFNGATDYMGAAVDNERTMCISVWVKLAQLGKEQVILANNTETNGYRVKISAQGKVVFDILNMGVVNTHSSTEAISVNSWTYLTVIFMGNLKRIYINGQFKGGGGSPSSTGGVGETLIIGRSKQSTDYFNGIIDELRIANTERSTSWMLTEYRNQLHPVDFISVSSQEVNPVQVSTANEFTGANGTNSWHDEGNWSFGRLPGEYTDVLVPAGKEVQINLGSMISINSLTLGHAATMVLNGDLEVNCLAELAASSSVHLKDNVRLSFKNDLLNNGAIISGQNSGTLVFNSNSSLQTVSGTGSVTIARLELGLALPSHTLLLNAKINISKHLILLKGILNANDQLTLLARGNNDYAAVMPVENVHQTRIIGNVNIQQFIDGDFSAPATARGWWLLSSPVYHSVNGIQEYNLHAIKQSVFVTGPGGTMNGFDASPNNRSTIYTHDQALPGTLSQKYTGVPGIGVSLPFGKGVYVFSRGSRTEPNAYEHQVLKAPFSNPKPYMLIHKGQLFTGELKVDVFSNNVGAEGDGYNLLGNPYASPITWGSLQKTNVLPFVWVFDPKNNAYLVTDHSTYVIQAGSGFFVKVSNGSSSGSITFTEKAKTVTTSVTRFSEVVSSHKQEKLNRNAAIRAEVVATEIKVGLKKDDLSDEYRLIFRTSGNNGITDADAQKIGEGHLSISGLAVNGHKLAIDEREGDTSIKNIQLFVKGWKSGVYSLSLKMSLNNDEQITLFDHYLNKRIPVGQREYFYPFSIDMENGATHGKGRFSLSVESRGKTKPADERKAIFLYPNPVNDVIYLRSTHQTWRNLKVLVRAITGHVIWKGELPLLGPAAAVQLPYHQFTRGLYILQLIDQKTNKTIASFKVLKN